MGINLKKISMKKLSITVSIIAFSILVAVLVVILNFAKKEAVPDVMKDVTKVGLILLGESDDNSWNQTHYEALSRISGELNLEVTTKENVAGDDSCLDVIKSLIEGSDCKVIIATSFEYGPYIEKAAAENPDRYFLCTGANAVSGNMGSYFGRMYQMRYLSGIIAGCQTKTGHIGYEASYPIPEVNRGVNAFTLGVRSVNPDAVVHLIFCGSWNDDRHADECAEKLISEYGVDVIASQVDSMEPLRVAEKRGIWSIGNNIDLSAMFPNSFLTACEWHWDEYYSEKILLCKQGKFRGEFEWLGAESGIVRLTQLDRTGNAFAECKAPVEAAKKDFDDRSFDVFYGPIKDTDGNIRVPAGESMSDKNMLENFDWYVEGVEIAE